MQLYDYSTGGREAHKSFNKQHKDKKLDKATHRAIILAINEEISDYLLDTGKPFKMGHGLGEFQVRKKAPLPPRLREDGTYDIKLPVDWAATKKLWREDPQAKEAKKLIKHRNLHSNGFTTRLQWKSSRYMTLSECWEFESGRDFNRKSAKILKTIPNSIDRYLNVK